MWESFERRYATEHYLAPYIRGQRLIERFIGWPAATRDAAVGEELGRLSYFDLRGLYIRTVELTPGALSGNDVNADTERWRPDRETPARAARGRQRRPEQQHREAQAASGDPGPGRGPGVRAD